MNPSVYARFIKFLREELAFNEQTLSIVERNYGQDMGPSLPMILWQYGLVTLSELDRIYDWLEQA
ncbi:MAG: DUF2949 domain-containing protein [Cyanobacteria bacterium P01_H01_bin.15]